MSAEASTAPTKTLPHNTACPIASASFCDAAIGPGQEETDMKHFALLNGEGVMPRVARATADGSIGGFEAAVMEGRFHLEDDPALDLARGCLCSRGHDECWHCGRGSKP